MEKKFSAFARRTLNEELVASKLLKSVVDIMTDYIYSIDGETLSTDEKKQVIENLKVEMGSEGGAGTTLKGTSSFMKGGKVSTEFDATVSITHNIGTAEATMPAPGAEEGGEKTETPDETTGEEKLPPETNDEELPPETPEEK